MEGQAETKPKMTEEERLALAAKLDKDLDDFIENLPKRQQPSGLLDENWLDEFDTHPFFMKQLPEASDKLHPLYEGLQQLKYDPNENTPEELALSYKEDGNFNFKHKNYRLAVIGYTEGIKVKCGVDDIEASLCNNRSAAHWYLKNYRSSLRDAEWALKYKADHEKAMQRAANCCFHLEKFDKCIVYCDMILDKQKLPDVLELRKKAVSGKKEAERDVRKKQRKFKMQHEREMAVLQEIKLRGIHIEGGSDKLGLIDLQPQFPEIANHCVHLTENKILIWPVIFLYPEYKTMDFVQEFPENSSFLEQLENIFAETPDWDTNGEYKVENLALYYEYESKSRVKRIDKVTTLRDVITDRRFILQAGTPSFMVLVSGSLTEKEFLSSY